MTRTLFLLTLGTALFGTSFGQERGPTIQSPVVLQPLSQVVADINGSAVTPAPQTKQEVAGALAAVANESKPEDPDKILTLDEELARLRALPVSSVPLKNARLAEAISLLAEESRMRYIAPSDADFGERVKMNIRLNPKEMLDVLAENFAYASEYDSRGVWHFYKINPNEPVTKSYTLRFNTLSKTQISSPSINSSLSAMSSGMYSGATPSTRGSDSGSSSPFQQQVDKLLTELRMHLSVPTKEGGVGLFDGTAPGRKAAMKTIDAPEPRLSWNADTSQLFATCTRQQHGIIERYLQLIDQPQKLIRISVKFVETTRNPQRSLGVDWSASPIGPKGGPFALSGGEHPTSRISSPIDLANLGGFSLPKAVLSAPSFQLTLNAFATDRYSSVVQDPVLVTTNNREVTFRATVQQPVKQGSASLGTATAATTSQIVYLEIGPKMSILPTILPGSRPGKEQVSLNISIETSTIVGETTIGGEPYPVISSKTYQYSVPIEAGSTLAIAGLDERTRETNDKKVPIFGDIPIIGHAFKSSTQNTTTTTLMAFITPTIEDTVSAAASPSSLELPKSSRRVFEGSPAETIEQLRTSLEGMNRDITDLEKVADTVNRDLVQNRLEQIAVELELMEVRLNEWRSVDTASDHSVEENRVAEVKKCLTAARTSVGKIDNKGS